MCRKLQTTTRRNEMTEWLDFMKYLFLMFIWFEVSSISTSLKKLVEQGEKK